MSRGLGDVYKRQTQTITAFISFGGSVWIPDGEQNKRSFMRLSYKPAGGNWTPVDGTKVAFGSIDHSPGVNTTVANTHTSSGSHLMTLSPGDQIKIEVMSSSPNINLLGSNGDNGVNYGDTYFQIIDMLGGEQGPNGATGATGANGPTVNKG